MGAGCCGGYSGVRYAPMENMPNYADPQKYLLRVDPRSDLRHHAIDPLFRMHEVYQPKHHMPYTRPEDGHASARLAQAAERLASPEAKYGAGMARTLYWNVSGV